MNIELGAFSVSLAVKDIEASKRFYDKLGFAVRCCVIRLVHTRPKLSLWKIASSAELSRALSPLIESGRAKISWPSSAFIRVTPGTPA